MGYVDLGKSCTGCGVCVAACPFEAIKLVPDTEGFLYPQIDGKRCKDCSRCLRSCPVMHPPGLERTAQTGALFAAYNKNRQERLESASGGLFSVFARYILEQGGYVVGAAYKNVREVEHRIIHTPEELSCLRGSKYIPSLISPQVYKQIQMLLEAGSLVLFSGTGCQVAALKAFLPRKYEKLWCIDVLCHGVEAPFAWEQYLQYQERRHRACVSAVDMRDKRCGWSRFGIRLAFEDGQEYWEHFSQKDLYGVGHCKGFFLRDSCDACTFKRKTGFVYSDLSIGDFWGGEAFFEDAEQYGLSMLILNNNKGAQLLEKVRHQLILKPADEQTALRYDIVIERPDAPYKKKHVLLEDLHQRRFEKVLFEHIAQAEQRTSMGKLKLWMRIFLPEPLKRILGELRK